MKIECYCFVLICCNISFCRLYHLIMDVKDIFKYILEDDEDRRKRIISTLLVISNAIFSIVYGQMIVHVPTKRIYSRKGQAYVRRLLDPTIPSQIYNCRKIYRMRQYVFQNFCNLLKMEGLVCDTMYITVEEQLTMFLVIVGQNQRNGVIRERFHRSA